MMTKRKTAGTTERTTGRTADRTALSPIEDNVVRMRHGFTAPTSLALETKAQGNKALFAELEAMERRALAAVGPRQSDAKRKIVSALRQKKR